MAETLATWFVEHLSGSVSREMIVFIVSLRRFWSCAAALLQALQWGCTGCPPSSLHISGTFCRFPLFCYSSAFIFRVLKKTPLHGLVEWCERKAMRKVTKSENTPIGGSIFSLPCPCRGRVHGWRTHQRTSAHGTPKRPSPSLCLAF